MKRNNEKRKEVKGMEIIRIGTDKLNELSVRGCCWPPGTETNTYPAPEDAD